MRISGSSFLPFILTLPLLAVGCSSLKMPKDFLLPENRMTAEEGMRLMEEGDRIVADAEAEIERGKQMVNDGRKERKRGEEMMTRGRQAFRAAQMLEEAERLRRKGTELKEGALE